MEMDGNGMENMMENMMDNGINPRKSMEKCRALPLEPAYRYDAMEIYMDQCETNWWPNIPTYAAVSILGYRELPGVGLIHNHTVEFQR